MANGTTGLTAETFDQLLSWLGRDRDDAARRYEEIRSRLIRVFICRGCCAAEELADETIDRVAAKVPQIAGSYTGNPALYFYGVAERIYLEHVKCRPVSHSPAPAIPAAEVELKDRCLEACMERIPPKNRELILAYYGHHNPERSKIEARRDLARSLKLGANALCIRAHRIREGLRRCVAACFERAQSDHGNDSAKGAT
jgi:DNA-directed RNA polymerase specialized sigma24 family protein